MSEGFASGEMSNLKFEPDASGGSQVGPWSGNVADSRAEAVLVKEETSNLAKVTLESPASPVANNESVAMSQAAMAEEREAKGSDEPSVVSKEESDALDVCDLVSNVSSDYPDRPLSPFVLEDCEDEVSFERTDASETLASDIANQSEDTSNAPASGLNAVPAMAEQREATCNVPASVVGRQEAPVPGTVDESSTTGSSSTYPPSTTTEGSDSGSSVETTQRRRHGPNGTVIRCSPPLTDEEKDQIINGNPDEASSDDSDFDVNREISHSSSDSDESLTDVRKASSVRASYTDSVVGVTLKLGTNRQRLQPSRRLLRSAPSKVRVEKPPTLRERRSKKIIKVFVQPIVCPICDRSYTRQDSCVRHVKTAHSEELDQTSVSAFSFEGIAVERLLTVGLFLTACNDSSTSARYPPRKVQILLQNLWQPLAARAAMHLTSANWKPPANLWHRERGVPRSTGRRSFCGGRQQGISGRV